jgi:hypothetical protein
MIRQPPKFKEALEVLAHHHVDFDHSPKNVALLLAALSDLDAHYRDLTGRVLCPEARALEGEGHHLLLTRCGPLDVLGKIGLGRSYQDLIADSIKRPLGEITICVLGLEALIRTKIEAGRDKDRAVLPILRRTLEESSK